MYNDNSNVQLLNSTAKALGFELDSLGDLELWGNNNRDSQLHD